MVIDLYSRGAIHRALRVNQTKMDGMSEASIILLTYNGEKYLPSVLQMIERQKNQPLEIIAIDSGSTDSTREILQMHHIQPHVIAKQEFGHARTRNLGAQMCSGKYVVFLTQDAIPADSCWLECLLSPFKRSHDVAASYSRQVPRPGSSLLEAADLKREFPEKPELRMLAPAEALNTPDLWRLIKLSNSSSAYDRALLLKHSFDERLEMAEDQNWAKRLLELGYRISYEPSSVVVHSHEHGLKEKYRRSLAMGRSFSMFLHSIAGKRSIPLEIGAWLLHILLDLRFIVHSRSSLREKFKWVVLSPLHRAAVHFAYRKGWNTAMKDRVLSAPIDEDARKDAINGTPTFLRL